MRVVGVDEAGRGPILGPMAVAVVVLDRGGSISLASKDIRDSKDYGSGPEAKARRGALADMIRVRAITYAEVLASVEEIDAYTFRGQLNVLERRIAMDLLARVRASCEDRIICDGAILFSPLRAHFPRLRAVDRGESSHVAVAAASILAKDSRDRAFEDIARRYEPEFGPVNGGGYMNAATRRFLRAYEKRYGTLPPEARKSWNAPKQPELPVM